MVRMGAGNSLFRRIRRAAAIAAAACWCAEAALAQPPDTRFIPRGAEVPAGIQRGVPLSVGGINRTYGLYVPKSYDPSQKYPFVVCLHGLGFDGDGYLDRWQPRLEERFILACPTMPDAEWWTPEAEALVLAAIQDVEARYSVDKDRVFLTGMSNGGVGTLWIGCRNASLFAGIAPMAGAFDETEFPLLKNLKNTPVYIIHGSKDQVMPVEQSRAVVAELRRLGYDVTYREHDRVDPRAGGHFFPREELPALISWFLSRRR